MSGTRYPCCGHCDPDMDGCNNTGFHDDPCLHADCPDAPPDGWR